MGDEVSDPEEAQGRLATVVFPRMFEPVAHVFAIIVTAAIIADALFGASFFKPVFFCYALSGVYVVSVVYEGAQSLLGRPRH